MPAIKILGDGKYADANTGEAVDQLGNKIKNTNKKTPTSGVASVSGSSGSKPTVTVVKGSVEEQALRDQYGDSINIRYGDNLVGADRFKTNELYQNQIGFAPKNQVDLNSYTGIPVANGQRADGRYDVDADMYNLNQDMRGYADNVYKQQKGALDAVLANQINALQKAYENAVAEGQISIRDAEDAFQAQKAELEKMHYDQTEKTALYGQDMGIQFSPQVMGLMAGDEARNQKLQNSNLTDRDRKIFDVQTRLKNLATQRDLDIANTTAQHDYALAQAQAAAEGEVQGKMFSAQLGNMQAKQANQMQQDNMALQNQFTLGQMTMQHGFDLDKMSYQQRYALEQMAKAYGYDMSKMSAQQQNQFALMAMQHGFDMEKMQMGAYYDGKYDPSGLKNVPPQYADMVASASAKYGVDPAIVSAIIEVESGWNPEAYNESSGASGLGQFLASTAREEGVDPFNPASAIDGVAKYLAKRIQWAGGDVNKGIMGYGEGTTAYLNKVLNKVGKYKGTVVDQEQNQYDKDAYRTLESLGLYEKDGKVYKFNTGTVENGYVPPVYANSVAEAIAKGQQSLAGQSISQQALNSSMGSVMAGDMQSVYDILSKPAPPQPTDWSANWYTQMFPWIGTAMNFVTGYNKDLTNFNSYQDAIARKNAMLNDPFGYFYNTYMGGGQ